MASRFTLANMPAELHEYISRFLGFFELRALRSTCRVLHDRLSNPAIISPEDLREAELKDSNAARNDLWPCYECLRIRPANRFTDISRKMKKGGSQAACDKRFCVDCGMKSFNFGQPGGGVRYHRGAELIIKKQSHVVCMKCRRVNRCTGIEGGRWVGECDECFAPLVQKQELERRQREAEEKKQKAQALEARVERRARYLELYGSPLSSDDDRSDSDAEIARTKARWTVRISGRSSSEQEQRRGWFSVKS